MKKFFSILFSALFFFGFAGGVWAAEPAKIVISPAVIDEQAEAKDLKEFSVRIRNDNEMAVEMYPLVRDIVADGADAGVSAYDKKISLGSWILFSRAAIILPPGKEAEISLKIQPSPTALPGKRHAEIIFAQGTNRWDAEEQAKKTAQARLVINLEVKEHIVEKLEISRFEPAKEIFIKPPVEFFLRLNNIGNRDMAPSGEIRIYNRRGSEIFVLPVKRENQAIKAGELADFTSVWSDGQTYGKFKAKLKLEYGADAKALEDTVYFYIFPWKLLLFLVGGITLLLLAFIVALARRRRAFSDEFIIEDEEEDPSVINLKRR